MPTGNVLTRGVLLTATIAASRPGLSIAVGAEMHTVCLQGIEDGAADVLGWARQSAARGSFDGPGQSWEARVASGVPDSTGRRDRRSLWLASCSVSEPCGSPRDHTVRRLSCNAKGRSLS
jgi:hypothetical protein